MSDRLLAGSAAPASRRAIGSLLVLDTIWVVVVGVLLMASTVVPLVDLRSVSLSLGDEGFRVVVLVVPAVAISTAVAGLVLRRSLVVAVATGMLVAPSALAGLLSSTLFLDDDASFADAGVALALFAAVVGGVALGRWFVYHPVPLLDTGSRPTVPLARGLVAAGVLVGVFVAAAALTDRSAATGERTAEFTSQFLVQTGWALLAPVILIVAGIVRSRPSFAVATAVAAGQTAAVLLAVVDGDGIELGSELALWTSAVGVTPLVAAAGIALAGVLVHTADAPVPDAAEIDESDDVDWRWT